MLIKFEIRYFVLKRLNACEYFKCFYQLEVQVLAMETIKDFI